MREPGWRPAVVSLLLLYMLIGGGCNRRSALSSRSTVRLNEVMARNQSVAIEDAGGHPIVQDWVELHNGGSSRVALSGYSLTDDPGRPRRFVFPPGAEIRPGGFLLVYLVNRDGCATECEENRRICLLDAGGDGDSILECELSYDECTRECNPEGLVADFGLSATAETGERLYLFGPDERQIIDRIGVFHQPADVANGRYPDGSGKIGVIHTPTPLAANRPTDVMPPRMTSIRSTNPDGTTDGFVEVVVETDAPVDQAMANALGPMELTVEYVMFAPPESGEQVPCPPPDELLEGLLFETAPLTLVSEESDVDPSRRDVNDEPFAMPIRRAVYLATIPRAPCETLYYWEAVAGDAAGSSRTRGCLLSCLVDESLTVNVNEYQPRNTKIVLQSVNSIGEDRDPSTPDWLELYNYGEEPIDDIGNYMLVGLGGCAAGDFSRDRHSLNALRGLTDSQTAQLVPLEPLEPGGFLWILSDADEGSGRRSYFFESDPETRYFSTRFQLDPIRVTGDPDGFCLISPFGQLIEQVVLDFGDAPPLQDQAVVRFPDGTGSLETFTNCPTPGQSNLIACELPPRFLPPVPISSSGDRPRCPPDGAEVTVHSQVNFDADTLPADLEVTLFVTVDGAAAPPIAVDLVPAVNQAAADPGMKLYDAVATIPGQAAGSLVVFSLEAVDLRLERDPPPEFEGSPIAVHDETTEPEVSFRYLVGFEPPLDGVVINEVLPGVTDASGFQEFAEFYNPADTPVDLSGYFLAQATSASTPIGRARHWEFPPESTIPPGERLLVFFRPPPPPGPGEDPLGPPEYIHVDHFNLSCRQPEALFLVAPDDPASGANCVLDAIEWDLRSLTGCKEDTSVGLLCDGSVAELPLPSPGEENVLPTIEGDSFHEAIPIGGRGGCVTDGTTFLQLTTVVYVDAGLVGALTPRGSLASATYVVERGGESEEIQATVSASPLPVCRPPLPVTACAEPAPGYRAIGLGALLSGTLRPVVTYRVRLTDVCGGELEVGPYSVGSTDVVHPEIRINEANRSFPLAAGEPGRAWVELTNLGGDDVDVAGMFLSDRPFEPRKAVLPEGTVIPAGGYAVVVLEDLGLSLDPPAPDAAPGQPPPPADPTGRLVLSDSLERGTCVLDELPFDFSGLADDASVGRQPDGSGEIVPLEVATPGASNTAGTFVRGDVNADGSVNVADMIGELNALFRVEGFVILCEDAFDANDDGLIDLTDPTYIGNALFRLGPPIPPPFPDAGTDPTPDELDCEVPRG